MAASPTLARDRIALYVVQFGAVAVVLAALPYKTFDLDRYFMPKELVLMVCAAVAAVLCIGKRWRITARSVDLLLAGFLVVSFVSALFATNRWAAERGLAISLAGAALFWVASALRKAGLVRPLVVALAVAVVIGAGTSLAQTYGLQSEYFSLNRVPGGTFGNRNFIAHLAAIGTPVVMLVALTAPRGVGSLFGGLAMAVVAATLVLSRSRAAWLAVIALAVPVVLLAKLTWSHWSEPRTVRRVLVLGMSAAVGVLLAIFLPNRLEWKSDSPYLDSAAGLVNYKEGSGRGRLVQYTNSLAMARAHPVLGVGPGNWAVIYPRFASRNDPSMSQSVDGVTSNPWPSSDWAAYLSERGALGCLALVLVMVGLLVRAIKDLRAATGRDAERVLTAIALVGTLVATAVVGAFDAVLLIAVPTYFVWTLAGALRPLSGGAEVEIDVRRSVPLILMGVAAMIILRSAAQVAAITIASTNPRVDALKWAALLDPGNYRLRMRLAEAYIARGECAHARSQAHAARDLFPSAAEPKKALAQCGGR